MSDITNPTLDATLYDSTGANAMGINSGNEASVTDATTHTTLTGIKGQTDKLTFTGSQLQVITTPANDTLASIKNEWQTHTEAGHAFSLTTPIVTVSGQLETDFLLINNPTGNTINLEIHTLMYTYSKGSGLALVKIYAQPTITTNGTSIGINKMKLNGSTSSIATSYYNPTISARGTLRRVFGASSAGSALIEYDLGLIIPPTYSLLYTVVPAANNADHSIYLDWAEH
jgi:hypothetical protein